MLSIFMGINKSMFSQSKIIIYLVVFTLLSAAIGGAYWYYHWSQAEIAVLRANNLKLDLAVKTQKNTIKVIKRDAELVGKSVINVSTEFEVARKENAKLRKKLADHDIGFLAANKPGLVQRIVNSGTADVGRCIEILSGAALTKKEKEATKPSQINSSCPDIANPQSEDRRS